MWFWLLVPMAAIFLHGWMVSQIDERGGNLAYAVVWFVALGLTVLRGAPAVVWGFCLLLFALNWTTAPVVRRGDLQDVLHVNPFHTPGIKWGC